MVKPIKDIDLPFTNPNKWRYVKYTSFQKENCERIGEYCIGDDLLIDHEYFNNNGNTEGIMIRWYTFNVIPETTMIQLER